MSEDLTGWMRGRGIVLHQAQRRWTRAVNLRIRDMVLSRAPDLQIIGMRSGGGVGASEAGIESMLLIG